MKRKWQQLQLGDLFKIKHGYAFKGEFFSDTGDYILLTPGNFQEEGGLKLKGEKEKYYIGEFPKEYLLYKGDLLVVMTDLKQTAPILGGSAFIPRNNEFLHNQRLGKIINLDSLKIDKNFLYYLFNSYDVREQIKGSATGSTVRHTSPERIYQVKVNLPPLPIQRAIASILSNYDDLIENNNRRIKILEEMAKTVYQEWFVKYRFPNHENVKMVESELGLIPEGWEVKKITEAIEINPRILVQKEKKRHFVPMGSLSTDSMLINDIEFRNTNTGSKFQNGDTLLARITPSLENGKTGYVQFLPTDDFIACGSTEFIVLRSKTLCSEYVYLLSRSNDFRENAIKSMTGTSGRQRVQVQCFDTFIFSHPTEDILQRFKHFISPLFKQIHILSKKNDNLRKTRDLLLPKLISGEIDVENLDINTERLAS